MFIQPGYIPLFDGADGAEVFFLRLLAELDELLLLDDEDDESRFFFDFFLLPLSLKMLSLELMLVILRDLSCLMSFALIIPSFGFFLFNLFRKSKPLKPFDGPLVSSAEYFVLIRSNSASRRRILSTFL